LVTESTYGDRIHAPDHFEQLAAAIKEVAEKRGCLLVPAFAIGRTQELIYMIRQLEDRGAVPILPVHIDSPMAVDATAIYARHHEDHNLEMTALEDQHKSPLRTNQFFLHRSTEESKSLNHASGPLIIISASGMATGGRILHHLKLRLPRSDTVVLLVGFQAEGTRGRLLQDGAKFVYMMGERIPVSAKVKTIDGLSAHADQAELTRWLSGFKQPPANVYITHGEDKGAFGLKAKIEQAFGWHATVPNFGDEFDL
jgi:metallo-beta-lactamase family protein